MDAPSSLGDTDRLVEFGSLPPSELLHGLRNLIGSFRRRQHGNMLAENFLRAVPVDPLRTSVPGRNNAIQIFPDDSILRGFHDGGQLEPLLFNSFTLRDIATDTRKEALAAGDKLAKRNLQTNCLAVLVKRWNHLLPRNMFLSGFQILPHRLPADPL